MKDYKKVDRYGTRILEQLHAQGTPQITLTEYGTALMVVREALRYGELAELPRLTFLRSEYAPRHYKALVEMGVIPDTSKHSQKVAHNFLQVLTLVRLISEHDNVFEVLEILKDCDKVMIGDVTDLEHFDE